MPGELGNYKQLVEDFKKGGLFVDKTRLIKEIINSGIAPILITRPRRWGKTLNLSMLWCWFVSRNQLRAQSISEEYIRELDDIFYGLNILNTTLNSDVDKTKEHFGKYPTIFISFYGPDISTKLEKSQINNLILDIISDLFKEFNYLAENLEKLIEEKNHREKLKIDKELIDLKSTGCSEYRINQYEKEMLDRLSIKQGMDKDRLDYQMFSRIIKKEIISGDLSKSINFLAKLLYDFHHQPVVILIDEYDSLFNTNYDKNSILIEISEVFRAIFSPFTKPNGPNCEHIRKVIFTGILRIAKANIFSGMNNVMECTVLDPIYAKYYGFTEEEVICLLNSVGKKELFCDIKKWYNGYKIGEEVIYNPWSVMSAIKLNCANKPYWTETADTKIIKDIILDNKGHIINKRLRDIIRNGTTQTMDLNVERLFSIEYLKDPDKIFSVLLHTGYLTGESIKNQSVNDTYICSVRIPNLEILQKFNSIVSEWLSSHPNLNNMVDNLIQKNYQDFADNLISTIKNSYDSALFTREKNSVEEVYHCLLLAELNKNLNGEKFALLPEENCGSGRADIVFVDYEKNTIVAIELKRSITKENLEIKAKEALNQAIAKRYSDHNNYKDFKKQPSIGICLCGSNLVMCVEGLENSIKRDSKKKLYSEISKKREPANKSNEFELLKHKRKAQHKLLSETTIKNLNVSLHNDNNPLSPTIIADDKQYEKENFVIKIPDLEMKNNSYEDLSLSEEVLKSDM